MTVQISGDIFTISTVEDLNRVQSIITTKFFEGTPKDVIIEKYFEETPHLEIYDRISDYPELMSEIVDRAVESETDYQTLDEASDALRNMYSALDDIYRIAQEWV